MKTASERLKVKGEKMHLKRILLFAIRYSLFAALIGCSFEYYFNSGVKAKKPAKKIAHFSKALSIWKYTDGEKNKANTYINRGIAYSLLGFYTEALADFDQALNFGKEPAIYYNRAIVYI
ncbi:MAG: tetratricopeptide repeat protein, partial [Elusimicrobiota bacterium]